MERRNSYLASLEWDLPAHLAALEEEALADFIPILRKEAQGFLRTLLLLTKPARILEIGTGVGFSALFMAHFAPENARIDTVESCAPRCERARAHFARFGRGRITLYEQDAKEALASFRESYAFIFLDAAKGQYPLLLPELLRLLQPGGVLLADNIFLDGKLLELREDLTHRERSMQERMRQFLFSLTHTPGLSTAVVPAGDGMSFTVKTA